MESRFSSSALCLLSILSMAAGCSETPVNERSTSAEASTTQQSDSPGAMLAIIKTTWICNVGDPKYFHFIYSSCAENDVAAMKDCKKPNGDSCGEWYISCRPTGIPCNSTENVPEIGPAPASLESPAVDMPSPASAITDIL